MGMGEVWNPHHGFCLDQQDGATNVGLPLLVFDCHGEKGNQYWYYRSDGTLGHDLLCVLERQGVETAEAEGQSPLILGPCRSEKEKSAVFGKHFVKVGANEEHTILTHRGADQWDYEARSGLLRHVSTQKCLAVTRYYFTASGFHERSPSNSLLILSGNPCSCGYCLVSDRTRNKSGISPIIRQVPPQTSCHYQQGSLGMWYALGTRRCTTLRNSDGQVIPLRWACTPISTDGRTDGKLNIKSGCQFNYGMA